MIFERIFPPNIFLAQNVNARSYDDFFFFDGNELSYLGFCDDFGPMSTSSILEFTEALKCRIERNPTRNLVYRAETGRRNLTNAVFLLGSYRILVHHETPEQVFEYFSSLPPDALESYRDATYAEPSFYLSLIDCWRGLAHGKSLGWIDARQNDSFLYGQIEKEEYDHYDSPLNGDLHIVVPGKFVAFRGPVDLPGGAEYRDNGVNRDFSPRYYVELFHALGVTTVVRLNERHYDEGVFEASGIRHVDLPFEDCTAPPDAVVARFFRAVDAAPGLVAVHCKAGLGRTGTLIALYLMRRLGFTARAAMGWLRVMRPGSVIGEQQEYLCQAERDVIAAAAAASRRAPMRALSFSLSEGVHATAEERDEGSSSQPASPAAAADRRRMTRMASADSSTLARQVSEASVRRAAALIRGR